MPFYDFVCKECKILVEDEFFKLAEEKDVKCEECGKQMEQVILKAPGLRDPGGIGQKWTNDGYQMVSEVGNPRIVKEKWVKGKNVIRSDVHDSDINPIEDWNSKIEYVPEHFKTGEDSKMWFDPKNSAAKWYKRFKKSRKFVSHSGKKME